MSVSEPSAHGLRLVAPSIIEELPPGDWLSMTIPREGGACYELFCNIPRIPEWLPIVRSVLVTRKDADGRCSEAAFLGRLKGATVGYSLRYSYRPEKLWVGWITSTERSSAILVKGCAQFTPLGQRSCLVTYSVSLDLGGARLPGWSDPMFDRNAASATLGDFRDFVQRALL